MPVDIHPQEKLSGVELILTRLHAGGKFSNKNYQFSGGLHGVGVSVVNALSKNLEVWIRRDGKEYNMSFADGERRSKLEVVGKVAKTTTGTTVRFWPNPKYFDSPQFSLPRLKHVLRAKAVLCPGLTVKLEVEKPKESETLGLHGRARAISQGVPRRGGLPAGAAVRRQARGQARSRRMGRGLAARRRAKRRSRAT